METIEAIAKRYSCRKFKEDAIAEEDLEKIIKAGMAAPVAMGDYDSLHLTIIQDKPFLCEIGNAVSAMIEKMMGKKMDKNFNEPALVIVSSKTGNGIEMTNAGCVLENMVIAASSLGIDSIIHAGASSYLSKNEVMLKKLNLPEGYKPVLGASFGYALNKEEPKKHTIGINKI